MGFLEEGKKIDIIGEVCSLSLPVNTLLLGEPFESFFFFCVWDFMLVSLLIFCMSFTRIWNASAFLVSCMD